MPMRCALASRRSNMKRMRPSSDQPTDNADAATPLFERERDDAMLQDFTGVIERIDRALARIDAGTYGICVRCGKPIEEARLEAFPNSEYNLECQEIVENE